MDHSSIVAGCSSTRTVTSSPCESSPARRVPPLPPDEPTGGLPSFVEIRHEDDSIRIRPSEAESGTARLWKADRIVVDEGDEAADWFSRRVDRGPSGLVRHLPDLDPWTQPEPEADDATTDLADGYPVLVLAGSTMRDAVGDRWSRRRFRANIVVEGVPAGAEDLWSSIKIEVHLDLVKPCVRCVATTVPIRTERGTTVAFGGRVVGDADGPKYVNTGETTYFHKGRLIYALDRAIDAVVAAVIWSSWRLHRRHGRPTGAELPQVGAVLGTATTDSHAALVRRAGARRISLVFDGDESGRRFDRLEGLLHLDMTLEVVPMPEGEDPADILMGDGGAEAFSARLETALPAFDFVVETVETKRPEGERRPSRWTARSS